MGGAGAVAAFVAVLAASIWGGTAGSDEKKQVRDLKKYDEHTEKWTRVYKEYRAEIDSTPSDSLVAVFERLYARPNQYETKD